MKIIDILFVAIATGLLVVNQIVLKLWLMHRKITVWPLNANFLKNLFSLEIFISLLAIAISGLFWLTLLKKVEFSVLYPMISMSYVFGVIAAALIFKESVPLIRWFGVLAILLGIFLISRN